MCEDCDRAEECGCGAPEDHHDTCSTCDEMLCGGGCSCDLDEDFWGPSVLKNPSGDVGVNAGVAIADVGAGAGAERRTAPQQAIETQDDMHRAYVAQESISCYACACCTTNQCGAGSCRGSGCPCTTG